MRRLAVEDCCWIFGVGILIGLIPFILFWLLTKPS